MIEDHIGEWVKRQIPPDQPLSFWHRVQSKIEDRYITQCGKQMKELIVSEPNAELVFSTNITAFFSKCKNCH